MTQTPVLEANETMTQPRFRRGISFSLLAMVLTMAQMMAFSTGARAVEKRATHFKLDNGMEVVVVPDRRAPVVTHMVWYRVGAADELPGVSGIAHFLEHLMFKGTNKIPPGEFSKIIARNGGQDNAFTGQDATAYFQRVAKDRLRLVMEMEADRMVNLRLDEKDVLTERDVILEERRQRTDNVPGAILGEQMDAMLYLAHPYRIPVIGWAHEMAKLSRADALAHYTKYYAPNNAILIIAGDVEVEEVRALAKEIYGPIKANPELKPRQRIKEPEHRAPRRVDYTDPRAGKPILSRFYYAPSYTTAKPGEAEAIDLMMKILASGPTSRLYKTLVADLKKASSAGGYYTGSGLDSSKIALNAVAADGVSLEELETLMNKVIADFIEKGATEEELERAKKVYYAEHIQEADSQSAMARRYGWALVTGQTIADVEEWPDRIAKVTLADIKRAAQVHLDLRQSVTGRLIPGPRDAARNEATPVKPKS